VVELNGCRLEVRVSKATSNSVVGNRFARANLTASSLVLKVGTPLPILGPLARLLEIQRPVSFSQHTRIDFVLPISFADSLPKAELTEASTRKTAAEFVTPGSVELRAAQGRHWCKRESSLGGWS